MVNENKRCSHDVIDPKTKKLRKCKKQQLNNTEYCSCHNYGNDKAIPIFQNKCCYCNEEIKIESQCCGGCARQMSMVCFSY